MPAPPASPLQPTRSMGGDFERLRRDALMSQLATGQGPLLAPGNIDLFRQPAVPNPDGTKSTVDSISVNFDGREYLIPTVTPDGRHLAPEAAIDEFKRTGRHLGVFDSPRSATSHAGRLHDDYAAGLFTRPGSGRR